MDTNDQQRVSSQNPGRALQPSHQARLAERNTRRLEPCEIVSPRGATNPEDGETEFGTARFAPSYVDASLDRRNREFG